MNSSIRIENPELDILLLTRADFEIAPPSYPTINPEDYERELLTTNLNRLGEKGWNLVGSGDFVLLFHRLAEPRQEKYKVIPIHNSLHYPGKGKSQLMASIQLLRKESWFPCGFWGKANTLILKEMQGH